jgi:hypothetical protein
MIRIMAVCIDLESAWRPRYFHDVQIITKHPCTSLTISKHSLRTHNYQYIRTHNLDRVFNVLYIVHVNSPPP